jgi:hypothetical protein
MFAGIDVHKDSIDISLAEEWRDGEVRHHGGTPGSSAASRARWRILEGVMDISTDTSVPLGRGSSATNHRLGGTPPADISSVNRR